MITEFGAYALVLALVLSALQLILSAVGGARRSALLAGAGRGAALGAFLCTALTFLALIQIGRDVSERLGKPAPASSLGKAGGFPA